MDYCELKKDMNSKDKSKMKTAEQKIEEIFWFIVDNGELVKESKGPWGTDLYKSGCLSATSEDEGYTLCVNSKNLGLSISYTVGQGVKCRNGKIEDLDKFYDSLFGEKK